MSDNINVMEDIDIAISRRGINVSVSYRAIVAIIAIMAMRSDTPANVDDTQVQSAPVNAAYVPAQP